MDHGTIYTLGINVSVFLIFFIGEYIKFSSYMNSKLNLLNSCKYQDIKSNNNKKN